ncbi:MAG: ABC transporter permease [Acidimicrobiales bacterium]|nr:ABC transporter permease [Acidimicrobiales bacterium]MCB9373006.1 ABC transporter permease [Microthrixaceae bacterium]
MTAPAPRPAPAPTPTPFPEVHPRRWTRISAIATRHAFVLRRSPHRAFDVFVWPVVDVLLWGSLGVFVAQQGDAGQSGVEYLLAGILLFHVLYQSQIALSTGFLEEVWSRNLLNFMTTPCTEWEYAAGVALFGLAKVATGLAVVVLAAFGFYAFSIFDVGWALLPIGTVLLVAGWSISLFVIGLVLRFGQSAEVLAWGILFVVMPLSGIFYPVDALPTVLQPVSILLPTTHAFAAVRTVLDGDPMPWDDVVVSAVGCVAVALLGLWFVARMLKTFRQRGYITRFS